MTKIVITRRVQDQVLNKLKTQPGVESVISWSEDTRAPDEWLRTNIVGASAVLCMFDNKITTELYDAAGPSLKVVSTFSAGVDHIDLPEAKRRGIIVGHTPDVLSNSVGELTVTLVLMALRRIREATSVVFEGKWPEMQWTPYGLCGGSLDGATIGFVGFGRIAQATMKRLQAFDPARLLYHTRRPLSEEITSKFTVPSIHSSLAEIARESDVVIVLCGGGAETQHLIGHDFFKAMSRQAGGRNGVLVNTGRGSVVDPIALAQALEEGWLAGAALDVIEGEPHIKDDHPLVKHPRCIITPHVGSADIVTRGRMGILAAQNLVSALNGTPLPAECKMQK